MFQRWASSATRGSCSRQRTGLPAGNRRRVTPEAIISASVKIGLPDSQRVAGRGDQQRVHLDVGHQPGSPLAWIIRTTTFSASAGTAVRSASARMVANEAR